MILRDQAFSSFQIPCSSILYLSLPSVSQYRLLAAAAKGEDAYRAAK
jgi:hypothetical protein